MSRALLLALLLLAPLAAATSAGPDLVIDIPATGEPTGPLPLASFDAGERAAWTLNLTASYTTIEIRVAPEAFEVARTKQLVPHLLLDAREPSCVRTACEYTLFEEVPGLDVRNVDGPARIANVTDEDGARVLRLGVPGPVNATLSLERDVEPPQFTLGEPENVTHIGFLFVTRTDELALADLQIREAGSTGELVQNPTAVPHVLQRFPVQGLDADTPYEFRLVFTDWAGNVATSELLSVRSAPAPVVPAPAVTPLSPAPNETVEAGAVVIRARIDTPDAPLADGGIRLFLDLREVTSDLRYEGGVLTYAPTTTLLPGKHRVSVEVVNTMNGKGDARWSFDVAGAESTARETPLPVAVVVLALALVALRRR